MTRRNQRNITHLTSKTGISRSRLVKQCQVSEYFFFRRPSFKYFSWHTSLVGLAGTTVMMFFISPLFSAVSVLLCCSLVFALNFLSPLKNQGS